MKTSWYIICTLLVMSCISSSKKLDELGQQLEILAVNESELQCGLRILEDSTRLIWDDFNIELSSQFPETTSEYIRGKMLEMRNAELIRMFQTFDSLPDPIKMHLRETEQKDDGIVKELETIQRKLDSIEMEIIHVFMKIEEHSPDSLENYRNKYNQLLSSKKNCD